jgi:acyl-CoA thioester hydrolase
MARIRVELPASFLFSTDLQVRIYDVNYAGHLSNDSFLSLIHEARCRFLASLGYSEGDVEGVGILVTDAAIEYKAEAFHGDVLTIDVAVTDIRRSGCDLAYRITNRETGVEVARVKTGIAFFDFTLRKVRPIPDEFIRKILPPDGE